MATFAAQWQTAKTSFENATNKKKPSEGFKQKVMGTGVAAAFRELDAKKTPKDIVQQVAKVKVACDTYIQTLTKAANDPKEVIVVDKPVYIKAINGLKEVLERLQSQALEVKEVLDPKDKTAGATPEQILQLKNYTEHVDLRESMVTEVENWLKEGKLTIEKMTKLANASKLDLENLTKAEQEGNLGPITGLLKNIRGNATEAANLKRDFEQKHTTRTSSSSDLMKARGDGPKVDSLSDQVVSPLRQRSKTAFGKFNPPSTEYALSLPKQVEESMVKIQRYADAADKVVGKVKPAEEYLVKFGQMETVLQKMIQDLETPLTKYRNQVNDFSGYVLKKAEFIVTQKKEAHEAQMNEVVKVMGHMVKANESVIAGANDRLKVLKQLEKQVNTIPDDAKKDKRIETLVTNLTKNLETAKSMNEQAMNFMKQSNQLYSAGETPFRQKVKELLEKK